MNLAAAVLSWFELKITRFDPGFYNAERAAQISIVSVVSFAAVYALARMLSLPLAGAYVGATVAQYLAWFIVAPTTTRSLRMSLVALPIAVLGVGLGVWFAASLPIVLALTAVSTFAAFAVRAWRRAALTPILAFPYAIVFTTFYDPIRADLAWYLAATLVSCGIYFAVRYGLWPRDRRPSAAQLAAAHRSELTRLLKRVRRGWSLPRALRRMHLRTVDIEERMSTLHAPVARQLRASRALVTHAVLDARDRPSVLAEARALLAGMEPNQSHWPFAEHLADAQRTLANVVRTDPQENPPRVSGKNDEDGWSPRSFRYACQVGVATTLAVLLGAWLSPERWPWAYLTAVIVFYGAANSDDTVIKGWTQVAGTLIGAAVGLFASTALIGNVWIAIFSIIAFQFVAFWVRPRSLITTVACFTAMLGVFFATTGVLVSDLLVLRIAEIAIGAAAGMIASRFVFVSDARADARLVLARLLGAITAMVRQPPTGPPHRPAELFSELERTIAPARSARALLLRTIDRTTVDRRMVLAAHVIHRAELLHLLRSQPKDGEETAEWIGRAIQDLETLAGALRATRPPTPATFENGGRTPSSLRAQAAYEFAQASNALRNAFAEVKSEVAKPSAAHFG